MLLPSYSLISDSHEKDTNSNDIHASHGVLVVINISCLMEKYHDVTF